MFRKAYDPSLIFLYSGQRSGQVTAFDFSGEEVVARLPTIEATTEYEMRANHEMRY